ncbi:Hypothetical protein R9X50_00025900 [Acrodontium crateriforme]|uniref:Uncharacterized protein n=1 Tax=Acrodontium crateriforme TaxID=150365 RepID=A0AAQ3LWY4_9PEZI|nr:Hypothetical protein R9X50_00025900 [Acrodontium crateriforme]
MFVDSCQITSIIDWQDAWIVLRLPEGYEAIADRDEKARIAKHVESSILRWWHEDETRVQNPELHKLLSLSRFHRRQKTVAFASELSDGDVTPLRGCLIDLLRDRSEFDTGVECPIQFSASELMTHGEEATKVERKC